MGNYKSGGQLQNNTVNGAMSITINRVINIEICNDQCIKCGTWLMCGGEDFSQNILPGILLGKFFEQSLKNKKYLIKLECSYLSVAIYCYSLDHQ